MRIKNCGRAASCVPRDDRDTLVRHKALRIWVRHKASEFGCAAKRSPPIGAIELAAPIAIS